MGSEDTFFQRSIAHNSFQNFHDNENFTSKSVVSSAEVVVPYEHLNLTVVHDSIGVQHHQTNSAALPNSEIWTTQLLEFTFTA